MAERQTGILILAVLAAVFVVRAAARLLKQESGAKAGFVVMAVAVVLYTVAADIVINIIVLAINLIW